MSRAFVLAASCAAALAVLALAIGVFPYEVDDAYVIARHARHWVRGLGLVMNPGGPRTDGVTEPLWLLPVALGEALSGQGLLVAKGVGIAFAMLAAARTTAFVGARAGKGAVIVTALAAGLCPASAIASVSGLGTTLAAWLLTEAWIALSAPQKPSPGRLAASTFLLPFTRPELVPSAIVIGLLARAKVGRAGLWTLGATVAGVASVVGYRLVLFGHPLPLAASAKPPELVHGLSYALPGLVATGVGASLVSAFAALRSLEPEGRGLMAILGVHVVSVVLAGGDWMPAYRLFVPVLPASAALLGLVVEASPSASRPSRWIAALFVSLALVLPLLDAAANLPRARASGAHRLREGRALARHLARRCRRVALVDAGYLPYASGVEVVDLAGLTDEGVAHRPGGHLDKSIEPIDLALRDPDCLLLHTSVAPRVDADGRLLSFAGHPVERRVAAMAWVRSEFRVTGSFPYAPGYGYVLLERRPP